MKEIRFHLFTVALSLVVGAVPLFASVFASPQYSVQATGFAVLLGLTTALIREGNRLIKKIDDFKKTIVAGQQRAEKQLNTETTRMKQQLGETEKSVVDMLCASKRFEKDYRSFDDTCKAIDYLLTILPKAKNIKNTRLSFGCLANDAAAHSRLNEHDAAIVEAIRHGATYDLLCARHTLPDVEYSCEEYARIKNQPGVGHAAVRIIETGEIAIPQMIILHCKNFSEVLVGWPMATDESPQSPVISFRDPSIVEFFEQIFERYCLGRKAVPLDLVNIASSAPELRRAMTIVGREA